MPGTLLEKFKFWLVSEVPEMPETLIEKFKFSLVSEVPEVPGTLLEKFKFLASVRNVRDARDSPNKIQDLNK